ncbi:MAG: hypothetical protein WEA99_00945 [Brumimicrobium sp.]
MLGLIFIYFLDRAYLRLAEEHNKIKWLWAVLSVVFYYVLTFIAGFFIALLAPYSVLSNDFLISIIGVAIGVGGSIGIYKLLQHIWDKSVSLSIPDEAILDNEI